MLEQIVNVGNLKTDPMFGGAAIVLDDQVGGIVADVDQAAEDEVWLTVPTWPMRRKATRCDGAVFTLDGGAAVLFCNRFDLKCAQGATNPIAGDQA